MISKRKGNVLKSFELKDDSSGEGSSIDDSKTNHLLDGLNFQESEEVNFFDKIPIINKKVKNYDKSYTFNPVNGLIGFKLRFDPNI
jgi:hypothetical protein